MGGGITMCGPSKPVQTDPEAEAQAAADKAAQEANKKKAQRKVWSQESVLSSATAPTQPNGKTTLGGG